MSGWIKLHRQLKDWEWYKDLPAFTLFLHLLLSVNHKPTRWQGIDLQSGECVTGLHSLSAQTGLSVRQIRTALDKLKSTNELTIRSTNKYSIISISKWSDYQNDDNQDDKPQTNKWQTNDKPATTDKNDNNAKKGIILKPDGVSDTVWSDFIAHRKAKKAPITQTAIKGFQREADKAGISLEKAIEITILRGWTGFSAEWLKNAGTGLQSSTKPAEPPRRKFNPNDED